MRPKKNFTLTAPQVHRCAAVVLQDHLKLGDHGPKCRASLLFTLLLYAAARITSLSDACKALRDAPSDEAARLAGLPHHHRKSMNIKELRIRTWVNAGDCPARSYAQSVAPGAVSSLLQATYVDQEKQRKSCPYKDLCLYC